MLTPIIFIGISLLLGSTLLITKNATIKVFLFALTLITIIMTWQSSLGLPRATSLELFNGEKGIIVGQVFDEPKSIYLWVISDGSRVPVSIQLPWDEKEAAKLQQAQKDKKQMRVNFQGKIQQILKNILPKRLSNQMRLIDKKFTIEEIDEPPHKTWPNKVIPGEN